MIIDELMEYIRYLYKNSVMKAITTQEFKERGSIVHNGKYTYDKTDLENRDEKCSCHIYSTEEFINDIKDIYKDAFEYDMVEFKGYRNKVALKCTKCGEIIEAFPKTLLNGNFGCECSSSIYTVLEKNVADKLDELNIEYKYQFKAWWLRYENPLSLDFYLPSYNIGIECQGRFHFEPYKKGNEKYNKYYNKQCIRDKIKYDLCKNNNIKIIYYSSIHKENYLSQVYNNVNDLINEITRNK